jgi:hypothetical protein
MSGSGHLDEARSNLLGVGYLDELPAWVLGQWRKGALSQVDLRRELERAWLYNDAPTDLITPAEWTELFSAAGFFSMQWGTGRSYDLPTEPKVMYRGATEQRARGMSWCITLDMARAFRIGSGVRSNQPAHIFRGTVPPDGILAILHRPGDGGSEFVVRSDTISDIAVVGDDAPQVSDDFTVS